MLLSQNGSHRPRFYVYVYEHKEKTCAGVFIWPGRPGAHLTNSGIQQVKKVKKVSSFPQFSWQIPEFVK